MENRAIDISHWDISKVTMKTDALDLRHVDQVLLSIQPETELWTLSSKVFICTPLSLWPEQSICSKELSFEKNHPNSYWTSTVHILRNMNLNLKLHLHLAVKYAFTNEIFMKWILHKTWERAVCRRDLTLKQNICANVKKLYFINEYLKRY